MVSQYFGKGRPDGPLAQLITVKLVVYAMAMMPKMQSAISDHFQNLFFATPL